VELWRTHLWRGIREAWRQLLCGVALSFAVLFAGADRAATLTWTGNAGDGLIASAGNWSPSQVPAANDAFVFAGTNSLLPQLVSNLVVDSLTFDNTAGAFTLGGAGIYSLSANGIANNSTNLETINNPLKLLFSQTWNANAGALAFGGAVNTNSKTLTIAGSFATTITSVISGTGALIKNGTGTLTLSGTNTYSGVTTINAGVINIQNATALGATGGGTTVNSGAALQIQNNIAVGNEALTLNGSGIANDGALRNISGTNSMSGNITLGSAATIGSDAGALTLSGNINNAGFLLTETGAGDVVLSGVISGAGGLTKNGTGTLTLNGTAPNTYTGVTSVNDGTLQLDMTAGKNAFNGTLTVGDGVGAANSAVVRWMDINQVPNKAVTINSDGLLDLNNFSDSIGSLNMTGGNVTTGSGTLTLGGDVTSNASASTATISGKLALGANRIFNIADGAAATDMLVSADISGAFGVTKNGTGELVFSGANTYTGPTIINAGDLSTGTFTITQTGTVTIAAGATYTSTGTLNLTPSTNNPLTYISGAGTLLLRNPSSSAAAPDIYYDPNGGLGPPYGVTIASNIDFGTGSRFINGKSNYNALPTYGGDLDFSGNFSGSANITFTGTPYIDVGGPYQMSYVLEGDNSSFTGGVTLTDGANLILANTSALTSANSVTFTPTAGAVAGLYLYGHNITIGALSGTSAGAMNIRNGSRTTDNIPQIVKSNATLTVQQDTNTTFNGTISDGPNDNGSGDTGTYFTLGLIKTGSGALTLGGVNSYTGGTSINGGTIVVNSDSSIGAVSGGLTINAGTLEVSTGFSTSRIITLGNATSTFLIDPSQTYTVTSAIGGTGTLNKTGSGTLALTGVNTYSGGTIINAGTVAVNSASSFGAIGGAVTLNAGTVEVTSGFSTTRVYTLGDVASTFQIDPSQIFTDTTAIGGTGKLNKTGTGTMIVSGVNTYSGGTVVSAGLLQLSGAGTLGSTSGSLTVNGGTLDLNGTNQNVGALYGSGGTIVNNSTGTADTLTIGTGNSSGSYAGVIADHSAGTGTLALTKTGSGAQTLTGTNTYTGATTVNAGSLFVNGSTAAGSAVTVNNSGSTIGGSGTISGSVNVAAGANLSPGASGIGSTAILHTGALTLAATSNFNVDLNSTTAGTGYDQLNVIGALSITGSNLVITAGTGLQIGDKFFIALNDASDAITGTFAQGATITASNLADTFIINYVDNGDGGGVGNDISLTCTFAVPEPSTYAAPILTLAALGFHQRRRFFNRGLHG
jgi:fibronectin-binding autotransporter adhesin